MKCLLLSNLNKEMEKIRRFLIGTVDCHTCQEVSFIYLFIYPGGRWDG